MSRAKVIENDPDASLLKLLQDFPCSLWVCQQRGFRYLQYKPTGRKA